ncbi:MAG: hypothetical protein ABI835_12880 [Chloroflexota bacterium]
MIVFLLPLLVIFTCSIPMLYNNARLLIFSLPFLRYPLPPQTIFRSLEMEAGMMGGAGNHCSFLATMHLRTSLTQQAIRNYYSGVAFPTVGTDSGAAAIDGLKGAVSVSVTFDPSDSQYVRVSLYDGIYRGGLQMYDPRCN